MKITDQKISWDERTNTTVLLTEWDNGKRIDVLPLTPAEAQLWKAEHGEFV